MATQINQPVEGFPVDQRPKSAADQDVGRGFARHRVPLDPQGIFGAKGRDILSLCRKGQDLRGAVTLNSEIGGQKRGVVDFDPDLFDRSDQEVGVALAPQAIAACPKT